MEDEVQQYTEQKYYSREEYLAIKQSVGYKSEYLNGEIVPMTGNTTNHNQIAGGIYAYLKFALREKNYRVYISNVRLWIPRYNQYTYPDVMVIEGEPIYEGTDNTTVSNPMLIVNVSSRSIGHSTEADKFRFYRSIPEFREYIMVDQNQFYVEQYTKNSQGSWLLTEYDAINSVLTFDSIGFQLSFNDIYDLVNLQMDEPPKIDYGF
ncbi:MAG: Uma2 family endonuclease [Scytonema sp. PMC 1069.18]|nr:Uma2 family endonuclease [Scytonema sp. PMC 1069.18]MEC4887478.1 Uma2 family endonuclease [Scytonema sp. PMC 1070.18]